MFDSWLTRADLDSWITGVRQLDYRCSTAGLHVLILTAGLQVFASWLTRADLDSWFTGVAGMFCHSGGVGGVSPMSRPFFKKKRPTLIFARKQILSHPIGWIDCHAKVVQGRNESV